MKIRWPQMFPGQVFDARLSTVPSQVSRGDVQVVLEVAAPAPLVLHPGGTAGVELVEATPEERAALHRAGFDLVGSTPPGPPSPRDKRPWWKFWG